MAIPRLVVLIAIVALFPTTILRGHRRFGFHPVALHGPDGSGRDPGFEGEGVCRGRPGPWAFPGTNTLPAPATQRRGPPDRCGDPGCGKRHRPGGGPLLPWLGSAGGHPLLGVHGGRGPGPPHGCVVGRYLPGRGHRPCWSWLSTWWGMGFGTPWIRGNREESAREPAGDPGPSNTSTPFPAVWPGQWTGWTSGWTRGRP